LIDAKVVTDLYGITNENLSAIQWASANLLNNPDLGFNTYFAVSSMQDIQMNFLSPPEIALSGCSINVTNTFGMAIFNSDLAGMYKDATFMNPVNYYDFENYVNTNDWTAILLRWGIEEQ